MARTTEHCHNCERALRWVEHSLPVGPSGDVVPVGYTGEWAAVPACKQCHDMHAAAGNDGAVVLAVLAAYEKATDELAGELEAARDALQAVYVCARDQNERAGHP